MAQIQASAIKSIALSVDVTRLTEEGAKALASDVEYRLREVIQDALKFARHSKRTKLTTQDVNNALRLRNIEPLYGFLNNNDPAKFVRAIGHPDVYFVRDATVPLEQITCAALPKPPPHTTVMPHWLFIDGVQPATQENALVDRPPQQQAKRPRLAAGPAAAGAGAGAAAGAGGPTEQQRREGTAAAGANGGSQEAGRRRGAPATPAAAGGPPGTKGVVAGEAVAGTNGGGGGGERVALPVQHILSDEMQRLLEQIKQVLVPPPEPPPPGPGEAAPLWGEAGGSGGSSESQAVPQLSLMQRAVLTSMAGDPGMQQLLPYLCKHVADEVASGLRHLPALHMVLALMQALLSNPHCQLEPYLHQLMPPLLTCCLAKSLGSSSTADHWTLRDAAAALVARLCSRYGEPFYSLQVKVSKQLLRAFLDGSKPLTSHYGAVVGLAAMGHATVRMLLLPQLEPYLTKLQPALASRREGVRQYEATRVYGALLAATGAAMYDKLMGAAAEDLLPLQLFRSGRSRQLALPSAAAAAAAAASSSGAALASAQPAPPPPNDPELDAHWDSLLAANPSLTDTAAKLAADPTSPATTRQLAHLRELAADPSATQHKNARALLHQLHKQGLTAAAMVVPAAQPPPPAAATVAPKAPRHSTDADGITPATDGGPKAHKINPAPPSSLSREGRRIRSSSSAEGGAGGGASRPVGAVLAESWREDADLGEVVGALTELFGPAFLAWLPQPPALPCLML